ncbi:MAG: LPS assembly lipoprotein LptE [Planctomycetota bacterium]|jgi:outer membrane lipopolysaccharide assembly protein LptE/RlpB
MSRIALVALLVAGCGYQAGQVVPGDGRTIAVPLFRNLTYRRDLERDLTRAVQQEILSRTRYHLVDEASDPDLVLKGRLLRVSEELLTQRSRGRIRESSVIVTVVVTVEDRRTGERPVAKVRLTERQAFVPVKNESLRTAEVAAMRGLAERIVYTLSAPW